MISRMRGDFLVLETLVETFPRILHIIQYTGQQTVTFMVPVMLDRKLCEVMESIESRPMTYKDLFPVEFNPKDSEPFPNGDYYRIRLVHDISIQIHESGA
jgi:hypothetical protein